MAKICFFELMDKELPMNYSSLKAKGTHMEKRATLEISMTIKGAKASFTRLPKSFGEAHQAMQDNPEITELKIDHHLHNMSLELYATPDSKKPMLTAHGATIEKFLLERPKPKKVGGKKGKRQSPPSTATTLVLWFDVSFDVKNDADAKLLTWDMLGSHIWWKAEPGQKELGLEDVPVTSSKQ